MMWIYEKDGWPDFTWNSDKLTGKLTEISYKQGHLLGRMESIGFTLRLEASLVTLTTDVVRSSAIEGEVLNPEEVRSSIAKRLGIDIGGVLPESRDVEGIVEIMLDATQNFSKALTSERLFDWHAALFPMGRSGMHKITVANWRPESAGEMQVVSGPFGREKVHFQAPDAQRIPREMDMFLKWFEREQCLDPVLKAGIAHFWFVTIHPFEDGNGRIGRAIADMALARSDGSKERFYSMSAQIESKRKIYYKTLELQQRGELDITGWLEWFLCCLNRSLDKADEALEKVLFKASVLDYANKKFLNERQKLILQRLLEGFQGYMTTSKYAKIAKCSQDTALRDIHELTDKGFLVQNPGGGRSTSYRIITANELPKNASKE